MPRSVLVIDNEPAVREILAAMLAADGMEVSVASHSDQALTLAQASRPDLVLLDVQLPGTDGWEILQHLRGTYPGLPVVMMSDQRHRGRAEREADGFIAKPYRRHDIVRAVRLALGGQGEG